MEHIPVTEAMIEAVKNRKDEILADIEVMRSIIGKYTNAGLTPLVFRRIDSIEDAVAKLRRELDKYQYPID